MNLRAISALALLALVLAAAVAATRGTSLPPADLVFNNGTEIQTLDPATVTGIPEGRVMRMLHEGLVISHPKTLEPVPALAERWDISDDGLVYTFYLRKNARWSNGDPLTSADLMWSYERFLSPKTAAEYAYQLWYVKGARAFTLDVDANGDPVHPFSTVGITAPDDYTVRFELDAPTAFFMEIMAFYAQFPVNRKCIEEAQRDFPSTWRQEWVKPERLVCNGPYIVEFRRINDRIRVRKNPYYWNRDEIALETIDVLAVESYTTMLNMYLTGEVHYIDRIASNVVQDLVPREDFVPEPYLGSYFYRVNVTKPPCDDKRVRRALALVIPRRQICEMITKSGQLPSLSLVPPGLPGYTRASMRTAATASDANEPVTDAAADRAEAKRLMAEAGFGPGGKPFPTLEIHYNTSEAHRDIALVIADAWSRELGIDAKLLNQEWKVYLDTQSNLGYDVSRSAWIGDYADPNTFIDLFVTGGENNKTGWSNAEYDRLVRAAARELDPTQRMALLGAAEALLMEELPILPIYSYATQDVYSPRFGGFYSNLKDEHFPQFWYWMDDRELAAKRAAYPADGLHTLVEATGPRAGLYSPAERARRAAASSPESAGQAR
ncbi:MAG: peptide ABC transporter substrate-binding protein [Planctomycetota bacterium]